MTGLITDKSRLLLPILLSLLVTACAGTSGRYAATTQPPTELQTEFTSESLVNIADRLRLSGDHRTALTFYQRARMKSPEDPRIFVGMGRTLADMGATENAIKTLRHAVKLAPDDVSAHSALAKLLLEAGQVDRARKHYQWLTAAEPDKVSHYNGLAVALDLLGDHAAAQANYSIALNLDPKNKGLRNNLALSFAFGGEFAAAEELLGPATSVTGTPAARQNLALVHGLAGEMEEAAEIAAIDLGPDAITNNLQLYRYLRTLPSEQQAAMVLLGRPLSRQAAQLEE